MNAPAKVEGEVIYSAVEYHSRGADGPADVRHGRRQLYPYSCPDSRTGTATTALTFNCPRDPYRISHLSLLEDPRILSMLDLK